MTRGRTKIASAALFAIGSLLLQAVACWWPCTLQLLAQAQDFAALRITFCSGAPSASAQPATASGLGKTLAPTSSTIVCPRMVGQIAAMAGRERPGTVRSWNTDIAIKAPVLPAETATSASLFFTDSMALHMLVLRPRRSARLGFSSMRTRSAA